MDNEKAFEEWKITRSTIVEFDRILLNIRALDVTATTFLLGIGFQYSSWLFLFAFVLNIAFFLFENHYHSYLHAAANHAISLENKIDFNLTKVIDSSRNKYKKEKKTSISFWWGLIVAKIYYILYFAFMIIGLVLFILRHN